MILHRR